MKRKLALFLVLALLVGLVPMNVFAATSNSVNKVPSVADDFDFGTAAAIGTAPLLTIKESDTGEFGTAAQTFRLELENAEWSTSTAIIGANDVAFAQAGTTMTVTYNNISDSIMEVTVDLNTASTTDEASLKIPMAVEMQGDGPAKVKVNGLDSSVTDGTYTFANGSGGNTKTYVNDTVTFADEEVLEDIIIDELVIGTLDDADEVTLKFSNSNFEFGSTPVAASFSYGGGLAGLTTATAIATDDNELTFVLDIDGTPSTRGSITISGLEVDPTKDAAYGDVTMKVSGDNITTETFTVGTYSDFAVTVEAADEAADLPTLYAGDSATTNPTAVTSANTASNDELNELSILTIEEDVENALETNKAISIEFPDWVKIMSVDIDDSSNLTSPNEENWYEMGDSSIEIDGGELVWDNGGEIALDLQIFVSIEADAPAGDIVAEVSGKGVAGEVYKVVLGKVAPPVTVTTEVKDVKIGVQDQAVGTITIVEAAEEVLRDDSTITLTLEEGASFSDTPTVKVTKGDVTIDDVEVTGTDDQTITITIDNNSTEASTIEVSGVIVDLDRTVAEGDYNLTVGGTALVRNFQTDGDEFMFDTDNILDTKYIRVITPAPGDTQAGEKVVFTIGSADYMIGAVKMTSDAAPYINEQGRTMLPLRTLANALGVVDTNIMWNEVERSVTIFKGDATLKVVIGQMSFNKNGVMIPMDTQAVIVNSRTFLPLRAIGQALGAVVTWDEATRTVTVQ